MAGKKPDPLTKRAPGSQTPAEERLSEAKAYSVSESDFNIPHVGCLVPRGLLLWKDELQAKPQALQPQLSWVK